MADNDKKILSLEDIESKREELDTKNDNNQLIAELMRHDNQKNIDDVTTHEYNMLIATGGSIVNKHNN